MRGGLSSRVKYLYNTRCTKEFYCYRKSTVVKLAWGTGPSLKIDDVKKSITSAGANVLIINNIVTSYEIRLIVWQMVLTDQNANKLAAAVGASRGVINTARLEHNGGQVADNISNAFSWKNRFLLWLKFLSSLFKRTIWQEVSIDPANGLVPNRQQAVTWINVDPVSWQIWITKNVNELRCIFIVVYAGYQIYWLNNYCKLNYLHALDAILHRIVSLRIVLTIILWWISLWTLSVFVGWNYAFKIFLKILNNFNIFLTHFNPQVLKYVLNACWNGVKKGLLLTLYWECSP